MTYILCVKTRPGQRLALSEIRTIISAAAALPGMSRLFRTDDGDVAYIDAATLEGEIAMGTFSIEEFRRFCASRDLAVREDDGELSHCAAQLFLEERWGQEVFSTKLPDDEAAARVAYAGLSTIARQIRLRLWSPMPGVEDIDLEEPGELPPLWHHFDGLSGRCAEGA